MPVPPDKGAKGGFAPVSARQWPGCGLGGPLGWPFGDLSPSCPAGVAVGRLVGVPPGWSVDSPPGPADASRSAQNASTFSLPPAVVISTLYAGFSSALPCSEPPPARYAW